MRFDVLFEQSSLVASKLKECIRDKGYTKVSFAGKTVRRIYHVRH